MIKFALKGGDPSAASAEATVQDEHIAAVPRISIQAFCASADTAAAMQAASEDRRMAKAHLKVQMGGIAAATEAYRASATPNVVIIESDGRAEELLGGLDMLAEVCDAGTRVIAIGHLNDIILYREMVRRGVSDYLIAPVGPHQGVQTLMRVTRTEAGFDRKSLVDVRFVPALPGIAREL